MLIYIGVYPNQEETCFLQTSLANVVRQNRENLNLLLRVDASFIICLQINIACIIISMLDNKVYVKYRFDLCFFLLLLLPPLINLYMVI